MIPKFDGPKFRPIRGSMFLAASLSLVVIFICIRCFSNSYKVEINILWYGIGGLFYALGAVLYMLRVPERCKPGTFDLCGASH